MTNDNRQTNDNASQPDFQMNATAAALVLRALKAYREELTARARRIRHKHGAKLAEKKGIAKLLLEEDDAREVCNWIENDFYDAIINEGESMEPL